MDQIKEILRQAIKYRFWIAVGISALLPMIAYAVGSGEIQQKTLTQETAIKSEDGTVKQYSSPATPTEQYKRVVVKEKEELVHDVNESWKKLYARQAPLLSWPKAVEERFQTWGRKWPENVDASNIQLAIIDYVTAYRKHVDEVYATFQPFDPIEGTGVVAAPSEDVLLKPAPFSIEQPPELGKVWANQERLWVQGTLLRVIADVNKDAKDWNTAIIKQLNLLEVGSTAAQDQVSIAAGELLEESTPLLPPGTQPAALPVAAPGAGPGMPTAPALGASMQASPDSVFYIKTPSTQYKILPVEMSVLIDQDHVQDLLVALENSPMAIQVIDFEMSKPSTPVVRPEKGELLNFASYSGGGRAPLGSYPGAPARLGGYGGARATMPGSGAATPGGRAGVDKRGLDRATAKKEAMEAATKTTARPSLHDPFYYVVEVTIYGQARFYNPPPPEAPAAPSSAEGTPAEGTPPAAAPEGTTPPTNPATPPAEGEAPKAAPPAAKEETPAATPETPATPPAPGAGAPTPKQ